MFEMDAITIIAYGNKNNIFMSAGNLIIAANEDSVKFWLIENHQKVILLFLRVLYFEIKWFISVFILSLL